MKGARLLMNSTSKTGNYKMILGLFWGLGGMFGFTWEDVVESYESKNRINHNRQNSGY